MCPSSQRFMGFSLRLMRQCPSAGTTRPKGTGGTIKTRRREVRTYTYSSRKHLSTSTAVPVKCYICVLYVFFIERVKPKSKRKEEPSSLFQRQRVDTLLLDLRNKFPPTFYQVLIIYT